MAAAVEGAGELMSARHAADRDVGIELHGLAAEVALGARSQEVTERVPAPGGVDGVLGTLGIHGDVSGVEGEADGKCRLS